MIHLSVDEDEEDDVDADEVVVESVFFFSPEASFLRAESDVLEDSPPLGFRA